ncbi:CHAT domain-containing protein [Boletus edulis]|nr:CHAT domain-containing protein [Boletus edulis]
MDEGRSSQNTPYDGSVNSESITDQRVVITKLKAVDIATGFRRIPAGFYVIVIAGNEEYRTSIQPAWWDGRTTVCEWTDHVLLPVDLSCKVQFQIRASFEPRFVLGSGILLRRFIVPLSTLIKYNNTSVSISFLRKDTKALSPCSSLEITEKLVSLQEMNDLVAAVPIVTESDGSLSLAKSTDIGHECLLGYYKDGKAARLEEAIVQFQHVLEHCLVGHPARSAVLSNSAAARLARYQAKGADHDLDLSISLYQDALDLLPDEHPIHFTLLLNLAVALLSRFSKQNDVTDANQIGKALIQDSRCAGHGQWHDWLKDLEGQVISIRRVNWQLPFSFRQLDYVVEQCKQQNDPELLDEVISHHYHALAFYTVGHPEWDALQSSLALALLTRFEHRGLERDLAEAIQRWYDVLREMPVGRQDRPMTLNNIAFALTLRFRKGGNRNDLDDAIHLQREALLLRPVGHPDQAVSMDNLATTLLTLFEQDGNGNHLTEAIQLQREALLLRPPGRADRPTSLSNLATTLLTQFEESGDEGTLNEAIQLHREAVEFFAVGHPRRCTALHNLATALGARFEGFGDMKYLKDAIQLHREVLQLRPTGHPQRSDTLNNLAVAVMRKFEEGGDKRDIDEVVQLHYEALELFLVGNPHRSTALQNLASALCTRFSELGGDIGDVDDAIKLSRESLQLRPVGHPDRPSSLNGLAVALWTRFDHKGDQRDLEEATRLLRSDLESLPDGNPRRPVLLSSRAITLLEWFKQGGDRKNLDEAIQHHRDALSLTPARDPDRSRSLMNLAVTLIQSFGRTLHQRAVHEAVDYLREALDLCPIGHPHRSMALSNLAVALLLQSRFLGVDDNSMGDVDEILGLHREALSLVPTGHVDRSLVLQHLAHASVRLGNNQQVLDDAIQLEREALELAGHRHRVGALMDLAESLWMRFMQGGDEQDFGEPLELCEAALVDCPPSDPRQAEVHLTVASIHLGVYEAKNLEEYLHSAMRHFDTATSFKPGNISLRVAASIMWARAADSLQHASALDAYSRSLQLLDSYISMAASPSSRHFSMKNFPTNLPVDAASCALRRGDISRAVELVEQGRALLWTQMARFRTPLDDLCLRRPSAEPLIKRFQELGDLLNQQSVDLDNLPSTGNLRKLEEEVNVRRYNDLLDDWTQVVEQIRAFEGFSRFLLPPLFSDLREASCEGPYQLRNETTSSTTAQDRLEFISGVWRPQVSQPEQKTPNDNEEILLDSSILSRPKVSHVIIEVLRELWDTVVSPVIAEIETILKKGSRIWWCPTSIFTAFPLHAAGQYRRGGRDLDRLYVSSYTPSLSALIKARKGRGGSPQGPVHFSAIVQAKPAGSYQELLFADREADMYSRNSASSASTRDEALCTLQTNHWIHFSCHGKQDFEAPFNSHLAMADAELSLLDIIHADLSNHEFAFLSACQTAVGDKTTPDEMIHLAAGLQFTGVKSVVGTLWTISDAIAYMLVPEFYKEFCAGGVMDCTKAARALHRGILALAKKKVPP